MSGRFLLMCITLVEVPSIVADDASSDLGGAPFVPRSLMRGGSCTEAVSAAAMSVFSRPHRDALVLEERGPARHLRGGWPPIDSSVGCRLRTSVFQLQKGLPKVPRKVPRRFLETSFRKVAAAKPLICGGMLVFRGEGLPRERMLRGRIRQRLRNQGSRAADTRACLRRAAFPTTPGPCLHAPASSRAVPSNVRT